MLAAARQTPPVSVPPPFPAHRGQRGPHSHQETGSDVPKVTQSAGEPSSPAPAAGAARLTLQVLVGGEAAHEAVAVEIRGPLLQLRPLVLDHLLPIWAAGLERCRCRVGSGPSSPDGGAWEGPPRPATPPVTELNSRPQARSRAAEGSSERVAPAPQQFSGLSLTTGAGPTGPLTHGQASVRAALSACRKHHPLLPLLG